MSKEKIKIICPWCRKDTNIFHEDLIGRKHSKDVKCPKCSFPIRWGTRTLVESAIERIKEKAQNCIN